MSDTTHALLEHSKKTRKIFERVFPWINWGKPVASVPGRPSPIIRNLEDPGISLEEVAEAAKKVQDEVSDA